MDIINDKKATIKTSGDVWEAIDLSAKEHTRILRKMDWHILPFISVLYLLSFL